jgi:hypothetical protein
MTDKEIKIFVIISIIFIAIGILGAAMGYVGGIVALIFGGTNLFHVILTLLNNMERKK